MALLRAGAAYATEPEPSIEALRAEIEALKRERRSTDERIRAIESKLEQLTAGTQLESDGAAPAPAVRDEVAAASANKAELTADVRVRYESTSSSPTEAARDRGVLRARLAARYEISERLLIGGRLATGDPDDPNSTDVTLSDFGDDFSVSLDQAYARLNWRGVEMYGGKMPNPFSRTELVWDGDVNPQGVSISWRVPLAGSAIARATALYFIVSEQAAAPDSDMSGFQVGLHDVPWHRWRFELAAAYYDYHLAGIAGADSGDVRSNLLTSDGARYLSDFDLIDVICAARLETFDPAWPVTLTANYVRNAGAATSTDAGHSIEIMWGRADARGDLRFQYGYSAAETDAVLAAFSHDNTTLATNYIQHTVSLDYTPWRNTLLTGTWYHYRLDDPGFLPAGDLDRVRINFTLFF